MAILIVPATAPILETILSSLGTGVVSGLIGAAIDGSLYAVEDVRRTIGTR